MRATDLDQVQLDTAPLESGTVPEAFQRLIAWKPESLAMRNISGDIALTWGQVGQRVRRQAAGLAALGVEHGDTVALILPNTIECHLLDYAAVHLGAVPFAVFNSSPANQICHQLENADARVVATTQAFLPKVLEAARSLGEQVHHIIVVDGDATAETMTLDDLESSPVEGFDFEARWRAVRPDDLATLIYTSGTTGPPKGAQWSHLTVMSEQRALAQAVPIPTDNIISFLPMAHAGGRITIHYMALVFGATITECPDMSQVPRALVAVHPDAFFSVPRLWEKLQVAIEGMIEAEPDVALRASLRRAVEVGLQRVKAAEVGSTATPGELAALVAEHEEALPLLEPLLSRIGLDRITSAFVGGAPSTPQLSQFFRAVGVPMLEAYGLTEGSLNVFNRVEDFKSGTAGKPLPGVELRLGDDGELLARADLNFVGYRKQPEQTAEAIDADGWLHTGDIAVIDGDGFVHIVDRKKEIIINAAGKNMSPVTIESAIKGESSLIGQIVAVGDRRRYVTALITLDPEAAPVYASRLGLTDLSPAAVADSPELRAEIESAILRANARLNGNEQVKKFVVLPNAWLPDSDELTPTAKLKRRIIHVKYADEIEKLYAE